MAVQAFNGSMVYWYNSTSYRDDLTWAAAWLYKATGDSGYLSDAYAFYTQHNNQEGIYDLRYLVSSIAEVLMEVKECLSGIQLQQSAHLKLWAT